LTGSSALNIADVSGPRAESVKTQTSSFVYTLTDEIAAVRPNFPVTPEQSNIGPLVLDHVSPDIAIPASINRFLKPYQRSGAEFFYRKYEAGSGGILGDDMGSVVTALESRSFAADLPEV
jgi:SNF2 family DNA or RNA helicase